MEIWSLIKLYKKYMSITFLLWQFIEVVLIIFCCYSVCQFFWYNIRNSYNFITLDHWCISNSFQIFAILTNTCAAILTIVFLALTIILIFTFKYSIIPFLMWITCCTIESVFTITWNMFCHCSRFSFVSYHIK